MYDDLTFSNKNVGDEEKNMKKDTEEKKKDQDYIIKVLKEICECVELREF